MIRRPEQDHFGWRINDEPNYEPQDSGMLTLASTPAQEIAKLYASYHEAVEKSAHFAEEAALQLPKQSRAMQNSQMLSIAMLTVNCDIDPVPTRLDFRYCSYFQSVHIHHTKPWWVTVSQNTTIAPRMLL